MVNFNSGQNANTNVASFEQQLGTILGGNYQGHDALVNKLQDILDLVSEYQSALGSQDVQWVRNESVLLYATASTWLQAQTDDVVYHANLHVYAYLCLRRRGTEFAYPDPEYNPDIRAVVFRDGASTKMIPLLFCPVVLIELGLMPKQAELDRATLRRAGASLLALPEDQAPQDAMPHNIGYSFLVCRHGSKLLEGQGAQVFDHKYLAKPYLRVTESPSQNKALTQAWIAAVAWTCVVDEFERQPELQDDPRAIYRQWYQYAQFAHPPARHRLLDLCRNLIKLCWLNPVAITLETVSDSLSRKFHSD